MVLYLISEDVYNKLNDVLVTYQEVSENEEEYGQLDEGKFLDDFVDLCTELHDKAIETWIDAKEVVR